SRKLLTSRLLRKKPPVSFSSNNSSRECGSPMATVPSRTPAVLFLREQAIKVTALRKTQFLSVPGQLSLRKKTSSRTSLPNPSVRSCRSLDSHFLQKFHRRLRQSIACPFPPLT